MSDKEQQNVDAIRQILFGEALSGIENKVASLAARIDSLDKMTSSASQSLRQDFTAQTTQLQQHLDQFKSATESQLALQVTRAQLADYLETLATHIRG